MWSARSSAARRLFAHAARRALKSATNASRRALVRPRETVTPAQRPRLRRRLCHAIVPTVHGPRLPRAPQRSSAFLTLRRSSRALVMARSRLPLTSINRAGRRTSAVPARRTEASRTMGPCARRPTPSASCPRARCELDRSRRIPCTSFCAGSLHLLVRASASQRSGTARRKRRNALRTPVGSHPTA